MQSPGRWYLAMPGKLLRRTTTTGPPVSMRGSVPPYGARKNGCCIGRKQESMFKSGAWTYISCNRRSPDYIPAQATGRHLTRWKQVCFYFLFSAAVTKPHPWKYSWIFIWSPKQKNAWPSSAWSTAKTLLVKGFIHVCNSLFIMQKSQSNPCQAACPCINELY